PPTTPRSVTLTPANQYSGDSGPLTIPDTVATTTTIAPLGGQLPVAPSTLPLTTKGTNGHVNPVLAIISGAGFGLALLIIAARLLITRSGGRDRKPLEGPTL
ncbi:MAG: hypothetical protein JO337_14120, partial [Acidimicrobiales bacterium]|nr:hypothetical protein [Acidimicrobiales bacterium]